MKLADKLLAAGMVLPAAYLGALIIGTLLFPGFDHGARLPSDLGGPGAPNPFPFNVGLILTGLCGIAGGAGLLLALRSLRQPIVGALAGLTLLLFGIAMSMAGIFPLPNALHYGFGLTAAGAFTPLAGAFALKGRDRVILLAAFALTLALFLIGSGLGGIVNETNVAWWVKGMALVLFPAMAVLCWRVRERLRSPA